MKESTLLGKKVAHRKKVEISKEKEDESSSDEEMERLRYAAKKLLQMREMEQENFNRDKVVVGSPVEHRGDFDSWGGEVGDDEGSGDVVEIRSDFDSEGDMLVDLEGVVDSDSEGGMVVHVDSDLEGDMVVDLQGVVESDLDDVVESKGDEGELTGCII